MIILVGLKEHNTINNAPTFLIWFVQLHLPTTSPINWLKIKYNKWDYTPRRFKYLIWGPQNKTLNLKPQSKIQMFNEAET